MSVGPHERFPMAGGQTADLYLVRFGPDGQLQSPRAAEAFLEAAAQASDVFVFSHGWNNTFQVALDRYRSFITGFMAQRQAFSLTPPEDYRPVMLGLIWPSVTFVLPWETGPAIAGSVGQAQGQSARDTDEMLDLVCGSLGSDAGNELRELLEGRDRLDADDARQAAALVAPLLGGEDPDTAADAPQLDDLLTIWTRLDRGIGPLVLSDQDLGTVDGSAGRSDTPAADDPQAAGLDLDPRNLLRTATLWTMKARAGSVGAKGLGPILTELLGMAHAPRVHLIGHSFGARVLLSATAAIPAPPNKAHSMLLLQAAVNRWCFADDVATTHAAGGYRDVPGRVALPILSTFSSQDAALTRYFHLALRAGHLGEPSIAAIGEPELYGALGGYGPAGLGDATVVVPAASPGTGTYPLDSDVRVIAVDGGASSGANPAISGHGDISNAVTWWALHCLTRS